MRAGRCVRARLRQATCPRPHRARARRTRPARERARPEATEGRRRGRRSSPRRSADARHRDRAGRTEAGGAPRTVGSPGAPTSGGSCRASCRGRGPERSPGRRGGSATSRARRRRSCVPRESAIDQLAGRPERGRPGRVRRRARRCREHRSHAGRRGARREDRCLARWPACSARGRVPAPPPARSGRRSRTTRASANTTPPARSMFSSIRAGKTSRPSSALRTAAAAPPAKRRALVSASHSACQAPAARWCSCTSEPVSRPDAAAAPRAHETASTDETGLRFCGIVDETPCPEPAASATSPTSVCASNVMSRPIFPQAPASAASAAPTSVTRTRFVCQGSVGCASPSLRAKSSATAGPSTPNAPSVPAAPPSCAARPSERTRSSQAVASSRPDEPTRRNEPERRRDGLLKQRAGGHHALAVLPGQRRCGRHGCRRVVERQPARPRGNEHRRAVEDVLARCAAVHPVGGRRADPRPQRADERLHGIACT